MGPKAKAKSKPKAKSKGKTADKKMAPRQGMSDKKKAELQQMHEQMMQERSVLLIQRVARGARVRRAFASLLALEDRVLHIPLPAQQAMELLSGEPVGQQHEAGQTEPPSNVEGLDRVPAVAAAGAPPEEGAGASPARAGLSPPSPSTSKRHSSHSKGASGRSVSRSSALKVVEVGLAEDRVSRHLEVALPDTGHARSGASRVFWLLSTKTMGSAQLHIIFKHHELRRRNANQKVRVRLVLMQHGDSGRLPLSPSSSAEPPPDDGGAHLKRSLLPEGWMQVTRTSWSLRLHPEFRPHLICSSGVPCCEETAERVRSVLDDDHDGDPNGGDAGSSPPVLRTCGALDLQPLAGAIGPGLHRIAEAVAEAVRALPQPPVRDGILPPPFVLLLVAGGSVMEALLACLCAEGKKRIRGRLGGGDIVMLESQPMMRVVAARAGGAETGRPAGEPAQEGVVRPIPDLWHDALLRGKWLTCRRVRARDWGAAQGAGRSGASPNASPGSSPGPRKGARGPTLGAVWRDYAGPPLVLSQGEFASLCKRAGSTLMPLPPEASAKLRPLVADQRSLTKHRSPHRGGARSWSRTPAGGHG